MQTQMESHAATYVPTRNGALRNHAAVVALAKAAWDDQHMEKLIPSFAASASFLLVLSSSLVGLYSDMLFVKEGMWVYQLIVLFYVINPGLVFASMYFAARKALLQGQFVPVLLFMLGGILAGSVASEAIWFFFSPFVNTAAYFASGLYVVPLVRTALLPLAFGLLAIVVSRAIPRNFRRETKSAVSSLVERESARSARGRLLDFVTFAFGIASMAISVKIAVLVGQNVGLSPIDYVDSVILAITSLLLIHRVLRGS